jgi:hypothetical protein
MDHLHQIFITKNGVLCSEVQKNFRELCHASDAAQSYVATEDIPLPTSLQEAHADAFPFFLNSRQFWLIIDGSLPKPNFFERNADGSLSRKITGWGIEDGPMTFIPDLGDESEEEEDEEDAQEHLEELHAPAPSDGRRLDPRKEVTNDLFVYELWPKMKKSIKKKSVDFHPSLVWMEFNSFIIGSAEALNTPRGYLSLEEYEKLGNKRAPNFRGDRHIIYDMFLRYLHLKQQKSLFDIGDLVFHLYNRMKEHTGEEWVIHQIFVDETQDFTQAELCLLIRCCQSPNHMFLTGDTAQGIMRGVSFRFEDLKSLFYYARESMKALGKTSAVEVPRRLYQLTHNYRSHAGNLRLASSIVDLMVAFFPESFDRLQRDQGLFEGPKPVLLESCSFSDLALLLRGSKRKTSQIEFGAHQAILVVNDAARDDLPVELSLGLVLTIFESKGLEFDDVLVYNFFKYSQVKCYCSVKTNMGTPFVRGCLFCFKR